MFRKTAPEERPLPDERTPPSNTFPSNWPIRGTYTKHGTPVHGPPL